MHLKPPKTLIFATLNVTTEFYLRGLKPSCILVVLPTWLQIYEKITKVATLFGGLLV